MSVENGTCPGCKASLKADMKFCPQCGAQVGAHTCSKCGASAPPDAKFCPNCREKSGTSFFGRLTGANEEDFSRIYKPILQW